MLAAIDFIHFLLDCAFNNRITEWMKA